MLRDAEGPAKQSLSRGGAEADDQGRFNGFEFSIKPGTAGGDFAGAGLLVDATLAAGLPFEMLDGISDVDLLAVDACLDETSVEEMAGGTDEGVALEVFAIAGLFTDEEETRVTAAFTEDGLGGVLIQGAAVAVAGGCAQRLEVVALGQIFRS